MPREFNELLELTTPGWWFVLAALAGVIVGGALWAVLGRVTSTLTTRGVVMALTTGSSAPAPGLENGSRVNASGGASPQLTILLPAAAAHSVAPGMRVIFSPDGRVGDGARQISGVLRAVRLLPADQGSRTGATGSLSNAPAVVRTLAMIALSADSDGRSGSSAPLAAGLTGSTRIIIRERRPISMLIP